MVISARKTIDNHSLSGTFLADALGQKDLWIQQNDRDEYCIYLPAIDGTVSYVIFSNRDSNVATRYGSNFFKSCPTIIGKTLIAKDCIGSTIATDADFIKTHEWQTFGLGTPFYICPT